MDLGIAGKSAIVTGGSKGIGKQIALALATEGARVAICARRQRGVQDAAADIRRTAGTAAIGVQADVMVKDDLKRLVDTTAAAFGGVDIVVANADFTTREPEFFELDDEDWTQKFTLKVMSPVWLIRMAVPHMRQNHWGRIVSIGGPTSRMLTGYGWGKGAAQAGLINVTKKLAGVLGRDGITVNCVEPGDVWTDGETWEGRSRAAVRRDRVAQAARAAGVSYAQMDSQLTSQLVLGRRLRPEDISDVVCFLCSQRSGAITGETILADGGENKSVRY